MTHFVTLGLATWLQVLKNAPKHMQEQSIPVTIIQVFSDGMGTKEGIRTSKGD